MVLRNVFFFEWKVFGLTLLLHGLGSDSHLFFILAEKHCKTQAQMLIHALI